MLTKPRLLTPGPTPLPEEVRLAMAQDMVHHRKPPFKALLAEVQEGLQYLFQTKNPVMSLTASGSGAMTAAVYSLFHPGETVLCIEAGKFGERWAEICQTAGLEPQVHKVEWGKAVTVSDIEAILDANPDIRGVLVQASETSTGVLHPIKDIATVTANRDVLLVVDGISAVGISPCPMDAWNIDCLLTGSQKGLMLPPGLAFVALSERALARAKDVDCRNFYFNLVAEHQKTLENQTLFTPAIGLLVGLVESLRLFRSFGLDNLFRKQWALTCMTREAVAAMRLELFAETDYTWGLTSIMLPPGIDAGELLKIAAAEYGVIMAGGQGHVKKSIVRIGHMGHVDFGDVAAGLYAFRRGFERLGGYIGSANPLEVGLAAYEQAMEEGPKSL